MNSTCAVDDCTNLVACRGWCDPHYRRWRRYGSPLGGRPRVSRIDGPISLRLWSKVDKDQDPPEHAPELGSCWVYTALAQTPNGYGQIRYNGRMALVHRVAWELDVGPLPEWLQLDHLCRTKKCVRPDHLEPVDHDENAARTRGHRYPATCGEGHPFTTANTYWYGPRKNKRACRTCRRGADERWAEANPDARREAWRRSNAKRAAAKRVAT